MTTEKKYNGLEIAIIGISAQFPGCKNWREYWSNLENGIELITTFSDDELRERGVRDEVMSNKDFVRTAGVLKEKDQFDYRFFGYTFEEATLMDPQLRLFHQICWTALEDAGYADDFEQHKIGLFAGASLNDHWKMYAFTKAREFYIDQFNLNIFTSPGFLNSLVAYKLNLRGPVAFVDTACSTSLSAVHTACRSLLTRECAIALAGGVTIKSQKEKGYIYREGGVASKDGHCRTFDAHASGTVSSEGAGVVVLKRLKDALEDGDNIYAVILSTAMNNDGNGKVGYTAPSVKGQMDCIRSAVKLAGVDVRSIGYIEAHGTATRLGDPVEVRALTEAFNLGGERKTCAIGSVKSNLGHADAAAGVAGLIKAALALKYKKIPASLNFQRANPEINFENSPFYVNDKTRDWHSGDDDLRRAGVSSFGIGGTNVHAILEEGPRTNPLKTKSGWHLLTLSAKTESSLHQTIVELAEFLGKHPDTCPASLAFTMQTGRKDFHYRRAFTYQSIKELREQLKTAADHNFLSKVEGHASPIAFMFSGQGSQYATMGRQLYQNEPAFRQHVDVGMKLLQDLTGEDFRAVLFEDTLGERIHLTEFAQPLLFVIEHALASVLINTGIKPSYMIGHSLGEYVAACISGVFSYADALRIVVKRSKLMSSLDPGIMASVILSADEAAMYLNSDVSLAAINGGEQVVFSGAIEPMEALLSRLREDKIPFVRLKTSRAFHSAMVEKVLDDLANEFSLLTFHSPTIPFVSNVSGRLASESDVTTGTYWLQHARCCVRFDQGIKNLINTNPSLIFVEVGPGDTLSTLVKGNYKSTTCLSLLKVTPRIPDEYVSWLSSLGQLWLYGSTIHWSKTYVAPKPQRVPLPTYAFEKTSFTAEVSFDEIAFAFKGTDGPAPARSLEPEETQAILSYRTPVKTERPHLSNPYKEPQTTIEHQLKALLEDFFGFDRIGVLDNFFELGGDSLKGMMMIKRINAELQTSLVINDLFANPTIHTLARLVEQQSSYSASMEFDNEITI